jgi:hypothetical protein
MNRIILQLADKAGLAWAQAAVTEQHYLHAPVDTRCAPLAYLLQRPQAAQPVGCLIFGRPEATRCYNGGLTYGSQADVASGRAQFDRWEILNLARVWLSPRVQAGGDLSGTDLPGFWDRRGVWRSSAASWIIQAALERVGYDYLSQRPPVWVDEPYQIRAVLSYCDRSRHRGTIYRAAGFALARTNQRQIETWYTTAVAALTAEQDAQIRRLAERSPRSKRLRTGRYTAIQETLFE